MEFSGVTATLVHAEQVAGIDLVRDIGQVQVLAVRDDQVGLRLESVEIAHDRAVEELVLRQGGFIDDAGDALGLDPLHDALDRAVAEIVRTGLHHQPIDPHHTGLAGDDLVGHEVLAGAVALYHGGDQVLRHLVVIRQQLLGVLGQAIAAIAEAGIVVIRPDPWVQADALDDLAGVQAARQGIAVQLVEIGHAQREVGVGEQLDRLGLDGAGEQHRHVLADGSLDQQIGEPTRGRAVIAHHDARGMQVVVKRAALAQELGREQDAVVTVLRTHPGDETHRDGGLDDDGGVGGVPAGLGDHRLDAGGVEMIRPRVIVRGRRDDDEGRVGHGIGRLGRGRQVQILPGQPVADLGVFDGRLAAIDLADPAFVDIQSPDAVITRQHHSQRHADVT